MPTAKRNGAQRTTWLITLFALFGCDSCPKCEDGQQASGKYCCWPGQRWSDERETCVGTPECPKGMEARAGGCMGPAPQCPDGMVGIGGARFHLGTNRESPYRNDDDAVHAAKVQGFCIDRTEVTVAAYKQCVDAGKCEVPALDLIDGSCNELSPERMQHPANCMTWAQAANYCSWANKRLPTEEEWQLAAGRMDGRRFPWGDEEPGPKTANLCGGDISFGGMMYPEKDGFALTAPVGSFDNDRTPFGVVDMGGNVTEWLSTALNNGQAKMVLGGEYSNSDVARAQLRMRVTSGSSGLGGWSGVRCASRP